MRHRKNGRQLGRQTKHRWALFRSLVTSLLEHERIETTEAKAKEIQRLHGPDDYARQRWDIAGSSAGSCIYSKQGRRLKVIQRRGGPI